MNAPALRPLAEGCLDKLARRGFAKSRVRIGATERHELNEEVGRINLLRTTHDVSVDLLGIVDGKSGALSINQIDVAALDRAVDELWAVTAGSAVDAANDIAPAQPKRAFEFGPEAPDYDAMAWRMTELLDHARERHPTLVMRQGYVDFASRSEVFVNSNGVDFESRRGGYGASLMFGAREGKKQSSFNYTGFVIKALDTPLQRCATTETLLRQTAEQLETRKVPAKFVGDLVITPDCLGTFLGFLMRGISGGPLIAGTSLYDGRLGERVVSDKLTLRSQPLDLAGGYFVTDDGFAAQNATIVERGVLESYVLDLYSANKTGLPRSVTGGGCWVLDSGDTSVDQMIRDVDRGLLITRFSGGTPNDKGDFSGIAKNSYYIEKGEVRYPVSETMVSGNLDRLLNDIVAVSAERADFGRRIYPWVRASGVVVS
jgi:PmbA protein